MLDLDAVHRQVRAFDPGETDSYRQARDAILALLTQSRGPASRDQFEPGHLTASGIVVSPSIDAVLLVHHKRLKRWLQPGGHIEAEDRDLLSAARREVLEETGADLNPDFGPVLVGMDVHEIPAGRGEPRHLHHDVLFAFVTRSLAHRVSDESNEVRWARIAELADFEPDPPLARTLARSVEILRAPTRRRQ